MGQDEVYLQVLSASGEGHERTDARKVLNLLKKGKHWVLVTLLLGNVITNETLPIMLDRSLGGGWQAVLGSTILIVIFGEIAPQSICVRYGLPIGAFMVPFVLVLMWILAPAAWPTAKLLDFLLGEDHGTTYKKAGLKTLVTLHRTLGTSPDDRLNRDEVTIISAVLDLKEKPVGSIMTPMEDVFTLSADTILDEDMMNTILSEGYSRIPIYAVNDPQNFIGMLLVKMLITYDPADCLRVDDFHLATLPETRPETSCLDIVNFFQEGKSHMVLVSEKPGEPFGALGVCTLEDVIEELIGEEIIDESDVFVDVHKAIRRIQPVAYYRVPKEDRSPSTQAVDLDAHQVARVPSIRKLSGVSDAPVPKSKAAKLKRRRSSGGTESLPFLREDPEFKNHLKHLGPSNLASRPKQTRINTVKIKPGNSGSDATLILSHTGTRESAHSPRSRQGSSSSSKQNSERLSPTQKARELEAEAVEATGLLTAGYPASDAVQAVGYGTLSSNSTPKTRNPFDQFHSPPNQPSPLRQVHDVIPEEQAQVPPTARLDSTTEESNNEISSHSKQISGQPEPQVAAPEPIRRSHSPPAPLIETYPAKLVVIPSDEVSTHSSEDEARNPDESSSGNTMQSSHSITPSERRRAARSGSIYERDLDVNGVRKVVLDIHEGNNHDVDDLAMSGLMGDTADHSDQHTETDKLLGNGEAAKKKKRKKSAKRRKKTKPGPSSGTGGSGEGVAV
jgi:metal transporter CNNM